MDKIINRQDIRQTDNQWTRQLIDRQEIDSIRQLIDTPRQSIDMTTFGQTRNRQYQTINRHTQTLYRQDKKQTDKKQTGQNIDGQEIDMMVGKEEHKKFNSAFTPPYDRT